MHKSIIFILGITLGAAALPTWNTLTDITKNHTPYVGQENRQISSLSAEDIEQLEKGAGWGLAKPAELNGFPGPAHVLELAEKLDLSTDQYTKVQASFNRMNARARALGKALIDAEIALDESFENGDIFKAQLAGLLKQTEASRAALREIHLAAHLEITPLLSREQKTLYAQLRGYHGGHNGHTGH